MGFFGSVKARFMFGLFALCFFVVVFAVPASAQEEYQITATLQAPELEEGAGFGGSVAVSGDIIVVGEPDGDVEGKRDAGRAYLFDSTGNLLATLQSPEPEEDTFFSDKMAVSGDIVVVSEPWADVEDKIQAGRAYLFDSTGNLLATLQSPEPQTNAWFENVAVSGDIVVVSDGARVEGKSMAGRAYLFDSSGNLLATLQSPTPQENAQFGGTHENPKTMEEAKERIPCYRMCLLAVSGDIIVIGERGADVEGVSDAGRAYIIQPTPKPTADYTPYLMAAAVIVVIVVATAVYVIRRKRQ